MKQVKNLLFLLILCGTMFLAACALEPKVSGLEYKGVLTHFSEVIVMAPQPVTKRNIYLQVINKSSVPSMTSLQRAIIRQLQDEGYQIVTDENAANYIVQADILFAGVTNLQSAADILLQGYQGNIQPAGEIALGSQAYNASANKSISAYAVVVDLTIWQESNLAFATATSIGSSTDRSTWNQYQTRIVATYSHELNPTQFSMVESKFNASIARTIAVIF